MALVEHLSHSSRRRRADTPLQRPSKALILFFGKKQHLLAAAGWAACRCTAPQNTLLGQAGEASGPPIHFYPCSSLLPQSCHSPAHAAHALLSDIQKSAKNVACDSHLEAEIRVTSRAAEESGTAPGTQGLKLLGKPLKYQPYSSEDMGLFYSHSHVSRFKSQTLLACFGTALAPPPHRDDAISTC